MIRQLGDGNVSYVSPAHSEILNSRWNIYLGESYFNKKLEGKYKKSLLYVGCTVGSKNISNNQFYSLGWNKLILHHKNGGGGRI